MSRSFNFKLQDSLQPVARLGTDEDGSASIELSGPLTDVRFVRSTLGLFVFFAGLATQLALLFALPKGRMALNWGEGTACWFVVLFAYTGIDVLWMLNPYGQRAIIRRIKKEGKYYDATMPDPLLNKDGGTKTTNALYCVALMAMVRATSIVLLAVHPAVAQRDAAVAAYRGFVLGWAAHALYTAMCVVQVDGYPVELIGLLPLSGGLVSMVASLAGAGVGLSI